MRNMDKWLGDGGMPLIGQLGARIASYGVKEGRGWCKGSFDPTDLACNPHGLVQAGVQGVVLDALMNFAVNASLEKGEMARATIEMKLDLMKPLSKGSVYEVEGAVTRMTRLLAFCEAYVRSGQEILSRATGTFLIARAAS
jgi:acyl-coenzyme A thioesterase PaaI-like protein